MAGKTHTRRHLVVALVVLLLVAAAGGSYLVLAQRAERARGDRAGVGRATNGAQALQAQAAFTRSRDASLALPARIDAAAKAMRLAPKSVAYRQQHASLLAEAYTRIGSLDEARRLLIEAWALDRSNTELRAQLREVNLAIQARSNWKAHVQHQREGPGGRLDPEDVIP